MDPYESDSSCCAHRMTDVCLPACLLVGRSGAEEYVLDLRGNPGGSVQSAVGVAGLFLDESKVVTYIQVRLLTHSLPARLLHRPTHSPTRQPA